MILDQDAYYNSQSSGGFQVDAGTDGNGTSNVPQSAKETYCNCQWRCGRRQLTIII